MLLPCKREGHTGCHLPEVTSEPGCHPVASAIGQERTLLLFKEVHGQRHQPHSLTVSLSGAAAGHASSRRHTAPGQLLSLISRTLRPACSFCQWDTKPGLDAVMTFDPLAQTMYSHHVSQCPQDCAGS